MAKTVDYFNAGVFEDHLFEAAHLYERRLIAMTDSAVPWRRVGDIEQRFDAHIDALVAGKGYGTQLCRERAFSTEPGETHASLRALCRARDHKGVLHALKRLPVDEPGVAGAAARALRQEAPSDWQVDLARIFDADTSALTGILANVFGYRRISAEALLLRKLASAPDAGLADIAWALGRVGSEKSASVLRPLLEHEDDAVCEAAAIAQLRLGQAEAAEVALLLAPTRNWPAKVLGVGGDRRAVGVLLDVLGSEKATPECVIALGLLGDLAAVAPLLARIEDDALGESVAVALNTITGARLYNEVLVPDAIDDEDVGTREDGEPFGGWEQRPLRDPQEWRDWLGRNKQGFHRNAVWRMGRERSAASVLAGLKSDRNPQAVRLSSYDELVVRFGLKVPFECNLLVSQQERFLLAIEEWLASQ